jgi:hypothetical protein
MGVTIPRLPEEATVRHPRHTRIALAATAAVATLGVGVGTAAAAASPSPAPGSSSGRAPAAKRNAALPADATLPQIQAAAKTDVGNRVNDLNAALGRVRAATWLGGDQATLTSDLQGQVAGLQQLGQKIDTDTDATTAKADYMDIFTQYRVYVLELPRTRLVVADDRVTNRAAPRLTKVAGRLQSRETPADQAQVAPLLSDLGTQEKAATGAVNGQVATLEAATPAAWNANHQLLAPERQATKTALADAKKAAGDARQAAADEGVGRHKGTSAPAPGSAPTSQAPGSTA